MVLQDPNYIPVSLKRSLALRITLCVHSNLIVIPFDNFSPNYIIKIIRGPLYRLM